MMTLLRRTLYRPRPRVIFMASRSMLLYRPEERLHGVHRRFSDTHTVKNILGTAGKGTTFAFDVNPSEPAVFNSPREPLIGFLVSTSPSSPRNPLSPPKTILMTTSLKKQTPSSPNIQLLPSGLLGAVQLFTTQKK